MPQNRILLNLNRNRGRCALNEVDCSIWQRAGEPTVPALEKRSDLRDRRLAALTHATRRIGARLNRATRLRSPAWLPSVEESEQLAELQRILAAKPQQFRLQFFDGAGGPGPHILDENEIWAADVSAAVRVASEVHWPPRTIGLRILDDKGREVFGRQRADRR